MPVRTTGGVFNEQILTGSLVHYVVCGADFSGAMNQYNQPVPNSAAEIIFTKISEGAYINIMNPNEDNLSFALEAGRSVWDEISLTEMVQSLGNDVGVDHIDCSVCTVKQVPYIWGCGGGGADSFLELDDTPDSYLGYAGYSVTVNPTETGLIFTPIAGPNAFATVTSPLQLPINAIGSDTLNFVGGPGIVITTDPGTNTVEISSSSASNNYISITSPNALDINKKYFVTTAGIVTLPPTGSLVSGNSVTVAKSTGITVFVNVDSITDIISTDLGDTDSIEMDVTEEAVFIFDGVEWTLQIGSTN